MSEAFDYEKTTGIPLRPTHRTANLTFKVTTINGRIAYWPKEEVHVPRDHFGLISIDLDATAAAEYEDLHIGFVTNPGNVCRETRMSPESILIMDDNYRPRPEGEKQKIEFSIIAKNRKTHDEMVVDPIIINE